MRPLVNTAANVEWAFANPGTGFRLSRQGSGFIEMEVFNNGNVRIEGALTQNSDVNAKTGVTNKINLSLFFSITTSIFDLLSLKKHSYEQGTKHVKYKFYKPDDFTRRSSIIN